MLGLEGLRELPVGRFVFCLFFRTGRWPASQLAGFASETTDEGEFAFDPDLHRGTIFESSKYR